MTEETKGLEMYCHGNAGGGENSFYVMPRGKTTSKSTQYDVDLLLQISLQTTLCERTLIGIMALRITGSVGEYTFCYMIL